MVKKVKKRARSDQRAKHTPPTSPINASQTVTNHVEAPEDGVVTAKARELCLHKNREINLSALSTKLASVESYNCEDCHQGKKGRGKHGRKGAVGSSKSESKAIWICLGCAHFSCGGAGLPDTPQSHAVRHSKTNRHPLVVHYKNHQLLWCFTCKKLVSTEMSEDNKLKEVLHDIAKLLKGESEERSNADVEDVWFGSGKETSETTSDPSSSISVHVITGYSIRGLVNLGNTCFFNSVMQNILAIESLRDNFLRVGESYGPLNAALRNLFLETVGVSNFRSAMDPRSVFTSLCTKAPQFRGYQQHDSQELLRCLLDALSSEELSARKLVNSSSPKESKVHLTFVDTVFGGQLSSTVSCLECGHSSTVFEPFLDLSLPVPTKKSSAKRIQPLARGKKPKLPPKRIGRSLSTKSSRVNMRAEDQSKKSMSDSSIGCEMQPRAEQENQLVLYTGGGEFPSTGSSGAANMAFDMGLTMEDLSSARNSQNSQACENTTEQCDTSLDCFSWLDYLDNDLERDEISAEDSRMSDDLQTNASSTVNNLVDAIATTSLGKRNGLDNPSPEVEERSNGNAQIGEKQSTDCDVSNEVCPNLPGNQPCNDDSNASHGVIEDLSGNQLPEVIALPMEYPSSQSEVVKEEAQLSSSVVDEEQDCSDFNVFGSLFDEPEVTVEPKSSVSEVSDTEANEVDDENVLVSVESCLALFTKPELLSKDEHAWQCDNCSKALREQMKTLRMPRKAYLLPNGFEHYKSNGLMGVEKSHGTDDSEVQTQPMDRETCNNEDEAPEIPETETDATKLHSAKLNSETSDECSCSSSGCNSLSCRNPGRNKHDADESTESESKEEANTEDFKVKRDATKSILISKTPPILTIHLKRFSLDARGRLSKLSGHVDFKEVIDLKPYMDSRAGEKELSKYRLVGVVEHSGTMRGGHYVAYVKGGKKGENKECWYHASDAYVREASLDEVLRSEAYILFYQGFF